MKWFQRILGAFGACALLTAVAVAQSVVLTPSTTNLSAGGGSVTFTASFSYTATPTSLGLTLPIPSGWTYVSGTNEPSVKPSVGQQSTLSWAYVTVPASPVSFTFTVNYPANPSGLTALATTQSRDGAGGSTVAVNTPVPITGTNLGIAWSGPTGNWSTGANWVGGIAPNGSSADAAVTSGTVTLDSNRTIGNLAFTAGTITGVQNLTLTGLNSNWTAGLFSGLGELVVAPGAILSATGNADHNIDQHTIRNQGTFLWTDSGALRSPNGGQFVNASGAILIDNTAGTAMVTNNLTFTNQGTYLKNSASTTQITVPFVNTGSLLINAGTLQFTNTSTLTQTAGVITLAAGATLKVDSGLNFAGGTLTGGGTIVGNVSNGAYMSPGNGIGTLLITGDLTLLSTSKLNFDIGGTSQTTGYDFLSVSGSATLGGTLALGLLNNAQAAIAAASPSATLTVLTANSLAGTFSNVANGARLTTTDGGGSFQVNYTTTSVTLTNFQIIAVPEPSTWALLLTGTGALAVQALRRRRRV